MYKPLCAFCMRMVFLREVAEELVSDVFVGIWKNRNRIEASNVRAYLYVAVRNRAIDFLRPKRMNFCTLESAVHLPSESYTLHDILEHRELVMRMDARINLLPKRCKMIYELSRNEGMRYKEIALRLNISVKTVEAQLGKAIRELKKANEIEKLKYN